MVRYKGFSQEESDHISHIFNNGSMSELNSLIDNLKATGRHPLERDDTVPKYSKPLYHGTADPGVAERGSVVPAKSQGRESIHKPAEGSAQRPEDHAFATEREGMAWNYAWSAGHANGQRAYVAQVKPNMEMEKGVYHHENAEWRSPQFQVEDRIDVMPGRQGTIPHVNWNDYKDPENSSTKFMDANHPSNDQVVSGPSETSFKSSYVSPRVHSGQFDLFSGKTAEDTKWDARSGTALHKYHRNALEGYYQKD